MSTATCPSRGTDRRKTWHPGEDRGHDIRQVDGVWHVQTLAGARAVLRSRATTQAGFLAEQVGMGRMRRPILYTDGAAHREQRAGIARYFAPRTVERRYTSLMERCADELVAQLQHDGRADLCRLAMRYSVRVAAEVVGLTESDQDAMARRLTRFFELPVAVPEATQQQTLASRLRLLASTLRGQVPMWRFHVADVQPAIRARRAERREDVISHLLDQGCSNTEILVECTTYAAAGMVTTREFIAMAAWHLLDDDRPRARYLAADQAERHRILYEVVRVEPVVGHLLRRTQQPVEVPRPDGSVTVLPAGALVDVHVRNANDDPAVVGEDPTTICPGRPLPPRVGGEVLAFGDGEHTCPGHALAIQETDVLLTRLLALPVRMVGQPRITWDELVKGYEVHDLQLVLDRS